MWKPTVVLWIFAIVAFASEYIGQKNIFQRMMQYSDDKISAPDFVWYRLNLSLVIFFILAGAANLYVAFNYDRNIWVNFKVFGITGLNLVFMIGMIFYLFRYIEKPEETTTNEPPTEKIPPKPEQ